MARFLLLHKADRLISANRGTRPKYGFYTGDRIGRASPEVAVPKARSKGIVGGRNSIRLNKSKRKL